MKKQTYYTLLALVPLNLTICSALWGQEQTLNSPATTSDQLFNSAIDYYKLLQAEAAKTPAIHTEGKAPHVEPGLVVPSEAKEDNNVDEEEPSEEEPVRQYPQSYQPSAYEREEAPVCHYPDSYGDQQPVHNPYQAPDYSNSYAQNEVEEQAAGDEVVLRGLVLADGMPQAGQYAAGVSCCNVEIPGDAQSLIEALQCYYVGQPITMDLVCEIKSAIRQYYRDLNRPFVIVEIPQQNITQGIIYVVIREAVIGDIRVCGNRWYNDEIFLRQVRLSPGQAITTEVLMTDVAWMNRNPFHRTDVVYTAGQNEGETNVELVTTDRIPLYAYAGYDNTGNAVTGRNRFFTGFTWGNPFNRDDLLSYQYTTNNDFSRFSSHFADYVTPLPWRHVFMMYGGYAKVRRHHNIDFKQNGNSGQFSVRYEIPYQNLDENRYAELRFGFDYKNTNNNLLFVGENEIPIIANEINLGQLMAQVNYEQDIWDNTFWASVEVYGQPGGWLPHSSNHDYNKIRLGAKNSYLYERLTAGYEFDTCNWLTVGLLGRGQWTTQNLLPSEQFIIGGYDTVRGYEEYEVAVDRGMIVNFELRTKPISFLGDMWCCIPQDDLIFLVFCDYGAGSQHEVFGCRKPNRSRRAQENIDYLQDEFHDVGGQRIKNFYEPRRFNLLSVGPGLRYRINRYFSARLDWGIRLEKTPFENLGSRVHFGIMASY